VATGNAPRESKVFLVLFFQKKNRLLSLIAAAIRLIFQATPKKRRRRSAAKFREETSKKQGRNSPCMIDIGQWRRACKKNFAVQQFWLPWFQGFV
jgi:hypothetical protein